MKSGEHARRGAALLLALFGSACSLFGGVRVESLATSAQKPSQVAAYVAVTDGGEPVTSLEEKDFRIYENGELLSPRQIERVLLPREAVTEERVLLLLDLAGKPQNEQKEAYAAAALAFLRRVGGAVDVSVRAYAGGPALERVGDYRRGAAIPNRLSLARFGAADSSRNLRGAVKAALAELDRALASGRKPVRIGTLVVFARGPDLAGRVEEGEFHDALSDTRNGVIGVGIGPDTPYLEFAREGVVHSQDGDTLPIAFEEAGARVAKTHAKYYLVAYCSPARGGPRSVRVEVSYAAADGEEKQGSASFEIDATGFGPGCRSRTTPRFPRERPAADEATPAAVNQAPDVEPDAVVPPPSSGDYAN